MFWVNNEVNLIKKIKCEVFRVLGQQLKTSKFLKKTTFFSKPLALQWYQGFQVGRQSISDSQRAKASLYQSKYN